MSKRLPVIVAGVAATLVLFFIAMGFGADLQVRTGQDAPIEDMVWSDVVLITVVPGVLAWGLAALLDRVRNGRTIWTLVALIVLVASFGLFAQLDLDTAGIIWQGALHLLFGLIVIAGFWVFWPEKPGS